MSSPAMERRRSTRPRPKPVYAAVDDVLERGVKRRRRAAKDKPKPKRKKPVRAARMMEAAIDDDDDDVCAKEPDAEEMLLAEEEEAALKAEEAGEGSTTLAAVKRTVAARPRTADDAEQSEERFVGDPIPDGEARQRWPERYTAKISRPQVTKGKAKKRKGPAVKEAMRARCHYRSALVAGANLDLGDDVYVKAGPGKEDNIGRITEFFKGIDHGSYFRCRWFFRVEDTHVSNTSLQLISLKLLDVDHKHDPKRVFLSEEKGDNMIESIISKINISYVRPNMSPEEKAQVISKSDLFYDMSYSKTYSTFSNMPPENGCATGSEATSDISYDDVNTSKEKPIAGLAAPPDAEMKTATLLDLFSGCGAMSTGLCMGAALSGLKLITKWAVDMNTYACDSLKHNHRHTQVRNEKAKNFLSLLQHWEAFCKKYDVYNIDSLPRTLNVDEDYGNEPLPKDTFEVEKLVDICYGDPNNTGTDGLWFKVRWKKYDESDDTWEPIEGLSDSPERIKEFVETGYRESILPLPGHVDVICGGPPCQGISGLNRNRKHNEPMADEKNKQIVVFMDIVNYLRPKYVLMENVVDILKFADGFLGRYALSRLIAMSYQARLGMMVAGSYGLPQFRMRVFLWGTLPSLVLPKFLLPTHDVINRGVVVPTAFSQCLVACDETEAKHLEKALVLRDAISDLPKVKNYQPKDAMKYNIKPKTEFQRYIRLCKDAAPKEGQLFGHQPLQLNKDDYQRVQRIPVKKGANFRDLEGVRVREDNTVEFDPNIPRVLLKSGKPLVPNYAMSFVDGKSPKPFGRLWWDETVSTVVTRAEPHNQIILHPTQHRVLTIRENARLQGFPDYYKLSGPIKEKYVQVGNAVAVPVARALGYSFGQAYQQREFDGDQHPLFKLPVKFHSY